MSALAKDLALKFSRETAPPPAKKEAPEDKPPEVDKVKLMTVAVFYSPT